MNTEALIAECNFKAVRSSGAGGQNVNKVASKIELYFNLSASATLNEVEKLLLLQKLQSRLTKEGILILQCDESRSQHKNKSLAIDRLISILENGLKQPKKRKPTKIPKSVIKKRIKSKRNLSNKKALRKPPALD